MKQQGVDWHKHVVLILAFVVLTSALHSQEGTELYSRVSPKVVYLRHEFYLAPEKVRSQASWTKLEELMKTKLLSGYLPIVTGSGFFVDGRGRIVTNRHVAHADSVEGLRKSAMQYLERTMQDYSNSFTSAEMASMKRDLKNLFANNEYRLGASIGNEFIGSVTVLSVAEDNAPDLALVELPAYRSSPLILEEAEAVAPSVVGSDVFSFGYPLGTTIDSSFKERVVTMNRGNISGYRSSELLDIQHSAPISPGNSGGPLLNARGLVVGVNTASYDEKRGNNIYFAVSAKKVRAFLADEGYNDILLWNSRYGEMAKAEYGDMPVNAEGEVECPSVVVVSVPKGISVSLDAAKIGAGQQAVTLTKPLSVLELSGKGYEKKYRLRLVPSLKGPSMISPPVESKLSSIEFVSDPPAASVMVDGNFFGETPLGISLTAGTYIVQFELEGVAFPSERVEISDGKARSIKASGKSGYPVTFTGISPGKTAQCVFREGKREYIQNISQGLSVPAGSYEVEFVGVAGLEGMTIPVEVPSGPLNLDVSSYKKNAPLEIRGLTDTADVWVDGVQLPPGQMSPLMLPMGAHTVSMWEKGIQPIIAQKITITDKGDSFINWTRKTGYDRMRNTSAWTSVALAAVGLVTVGCTTYMGSDDFAIDHTDSYDEYSDWIDKMDSIRIAGITLSVTAIIPAILAIRNHNKYIGQMKELKK